jgi:hypothetical protein
MTAASSSGEHGWRRLRQFVDKSAQLAFSTLTEARCRVGRGRAVA